MEDRNPFEISTPAAIEIWREKLRLKEFLDKPASKCGSKADEALLLAGASIGEHGEADFPEQTTEERPSIHSGHILPSWPATQTISALALIGLASTFLLLLVYVMGNANGYANGLEDGKEIQAVNGR